MATRRRRPEPMGCMQQLAVGGLLVLILLGISVVKAIAALGTVALMLAVPIIVLYLILRGRKAKSSRRVAQARQRQEPAVRLLTALAYTDDKLSAKEKDVLTSYLRSYPDADPEAVFARPTSMPAMREIDGLIDTCQMTLSPGENDVLAQHVVRLRATRRTHAGAAARWFDDAVRRLSRNPTPSPVINDISEA